ncbi:GNAT family N-acetyltransferase [Streptosporangium lutulentum]|uniref:Ribosomal protein S18 acetylase RimI-like enzyme n=1 Tax=Streptosporangium lutulentum TaxID=1461250 RepID=A0ABT9Q7X7_9ACTN|nr:GNAT family N-acetyltransferase [Streptosporangium lutulentum]MDP9842832.1 ribosomal protein S18 acetylase RimI-like enzyme [Streptosporangium lutulentum]
MTDVEIRRLVSGEGERYRRIRLKALADSPEAFASTYGKEVAFTAELWEERLASEVAILVAVVDGVDAGIVGVMPGGGEHPGRAHLVSMWIDPAVRGRGAGGRLMDAALSQARKMGAEEVELWVVDGNESAIALYKSRGFTPSGMRGTLPSDPSVFESHHLLENLLQA